PSELAAMGRNFKSAALRLPRSVAEASSFPACPSGAPEPVSTIPAPAAMTTPSLDSFRRIVVKIGSSLLVDVQAGALNEAWLASLSEDIATLHGADRDILIVSSGAIALGRSLLKLTPGPLRLEDSQAAAAVGQIALARTWAEALGRHGITAGQILLTLGDT